MTTNCPQSLVTAVEAILAADHFRNYHLVGLLGELLEGAAILGFDAAIQSMTASMQAADAIVNENCECFGQVFDYFSRITTAADFATVAIPEASNLIGRLLEPLPEELQPHATVDNAIHCLTELGSHVESQVLLAVAKQYVYDQYTWTRRELTN